MKLRKGDNVIVLSGKDKGKTGTITKVLVKTNQVVIDGVNVMKRHEKPSQRNQDGGIVEFSAPLNASNVAYLDGKGNTPSKIGYKIDNGQKVRVAKKSGQTLA
jgi:large subunit ribosomal protein L24